MQKNSIWNKKNVQKLLIFELSLFIIAIGVYFLGNFFIDLKIKEVLFSI